MMYIIIKKYQNAYMQQKIILPSICGRSMTSETEQIKNAMHSHANVASSIYSTTRHTQLRNINHRQRKKKEKANMTVSYEAKSIFTR